MSRYVATMQVDDNGDFEVTVGEVGWSAELLGTVQGGDGMFARAELLLDDRYGWRPVDGEAWVAVPGSNLDLFVVAVEQ